MKKIVLTISSICLLSAAAFAQFSASTIWSINKMVDPMPHNTINLLYFDMAVTYNSNGVPTSGSSTATPGLPLPKFRITSTVNGNATVCVSSEQEDADPWEDKERATFMSNGSIDTSIIVEESSNGSPFEMRSKIVYEAGANANQFTYWSYDWTVSNEWSLRGKTFYYLTSGRVDSTVQYGYTSTTDSTLKGYTIYYYSTGMDSSVSTGFNPVTSQFEDEDKVIVDQKENGKTKRFSLYSKNNGTWSSNATFTYKNGPATSVNDLELNPTFAIYPNPATTTLQLQFAQPSFVKDVHIINLNGQTVKATQHAANIDISELPTGLYFVQVITENGISTQKFTKN